VIIGSLRHRITLEQYTATRDPVSGAEIESWATYLADVPASVVSVSGKEYLSASAEQAGIQARVTVRYDSGITSKMRLVWDGKTYQIKDVFPDPTARNYLVLMITP
jgi:SPP1 family predicted phage head-tail adaptor